MTVELGFFELVAVAQMVGWDLKYEPSIHIINGTDVSFMSIFLMYINLTLLTASVSPSPIVRSSNTLVSKHGWL